MSIKYLVLSSKREARGGGVGPTWSRRTRVTKNVLVFLVVFLLLNTYYLILNSSSVLAQVLSLNPSTATKNTGVEFSVDLNIDTAGKAVAGTDVKLTFDPNILEVTKVERGDFFSDGAHNIGSGTLYIGGFFPPQFETKTGTGKVATIFLKGKVDGTSALTFVCTPQTSDTNILDASANDIVNCALMSNGSYIIAAGGAQPTNTPAPTSPPYGPTTVPPVSGITIPTVFSLGIGAVLAILGIALAF